MKQLIRFGIIGTIGFITDASVLLFFVNFLDFSIEVSRIFSFLVAVLVTWVLNRSFTFSSRKYSKSKESTLYFVIQTLGAFLNYIIFLILVYSFPIFKEYLIIPLAIASIVVMFFNFFTIKNKVYN